MSTTLPDWLRPGCHVYADPKKLKLYSIPEAVHAYWLEVLKVEAQTAFVRRYRPGADRGWCVGVEPVTWSVAVEALLPRPQKPNQNKTGFAMSAVVADHVEKEPGDDFEF